MVITLIDTRCVQRRRHYPIRPTKTGIEVTLGIDTSGVWFPDQRGPKLYAGGALWLGVNLGL